MEQMSDILLLVDYRRCFYSTTRPREIGMDLDALRRAFAKHGITLTIRTFQEVNFRDDDFRGKYVLYQSSEDTGLLYKDFIEDVLLGISLSGGLLIPDFYKFRAHHNKVFMEILRDLSPEEAVQSCRAWYYGALEELLENRETHEGKRVLKSSSGSGSNGVVLAQSGRDLVRLARRISRSYHAVDWIKDRLKWALRPWHRRMSHHRKKFVVQEYLADLQDDYKVLVYHDKYYLLRRRIKKGDFRASGSGLFSWLEAPPAGLLDFAEGVHQSFDVPMSSLDIAQRDSYCHLLEFQFLHFGPLTLEQSDFYFRRMAGAWTRVEGKSVVEQEFARSVARYTEGAIHRPGHMQETGET